MSSKTKKFLTVVAVTAVASIGLAGPSSAASQKQPVNDKNGSSIMMRLGNDTWCC